MHLITDVKTIEIQKDSEICLFEVKNMYPNIPKIETTDIVANILKIRLRYQRK
jgi:hypothetical protein